jgi:hypothetical protein
MTSKLTIIDNLTQETIREEISEKDLSNVSIVEAYKEFGVEVSRDVHYFKRYFNCYLLREREGFISYKIEFNV